MEWEDLLVRLELMPKALRVLIEDIDDNAAPVGLLLRDLIAREKFVRNFMERAAAMEMSPSEQDVEAQPARRQRDALDRFVRLRTRNFAMVQRRGIDVWQWEGRTDGEHRATIFQVLTLLAREDVSALAAVRSFATTGVSVC